MTTADDTARPDGDARRRRPRRLVVRILVVLAGAWLVVAGILVLLGTLAAQDGKDELEQVADTIELRDILDTDSSILADASQSFATAEARLGHPLVAPLRVVPVLGRQLRAAQSLSAAADELLVAGTETLDALAAERDAGLDSGARRLEFLTTARERLGALATTISGLDLGPESALFDVIASARTDAARRLAELSADVDDARVVIGAMVDVLADSEYLVLAANNAEMRVGSGMFLSIGPATFEQGAVSVGDFLPARELVLADPVPLPPEIEQLWGFASPGTEWRNLGLTARFPVNAALAAQMWEANGFAPVDGVLSLDVIGVQLLLEATGPVTVGDRTIASDGVAQLLLHDQYIGVDGADANAARREQLAPIAAAVVEAVGGGGVDVVELFEAFRDMKRGRHLVVWSADPTHQRGWEALGVDGEVDARSILVGVANAGGNKLDQFLFVDASVDAVPRAGDRSVVDVELELTVANRTPRGEPPYILNEDGSGEYSGFVVVHLPGVAGDIVAEGGGGVVASGPDGPTQVVGVIVDIPRQEEIVVRLRFGLPAAVAADLAVVPSARVPPTQWVHEDDRFSDRIEDDLRLIDG